MDAGLAKQAAENVLPDLVPTVLIPASAIIAIVFGLWLWKRVSYITLVPGATGRDLRKPPLRAPPEARRRWLDHGFHGV